MVSFRTAAETEAADAAAEAVVDADSGAGIPDSDDESCNAISMDACDEAWAIIVDVDGGRFKAAEDAAVVDDEMSDEAAEDLNADFSAAAADDVADAAT